MKKKGLDVKMPTTTITVDARIKARLADVARQAGQEVDKFAEALLRRVYYRGHGGKWHLVARFA
jgi:hypothetical protein